MEVTNRFKELDLVDRMCEELWMELHNIVQESVTKTMPPKNARRQRNCLRSFTDIRKEETLKTKEKGKDIPN